MNRKDEQRLLSEIAIFIGFIFMVVFVFILLSTQNKTIKTISLSLNDLSQNSASRNVVYIEVPYVYYDEELAIEMNKRMVEEYMNKLTPENAEFWWSGYCIMMEDKDSQPEHITDIYTEAELQYLYRCVETEVHGGDFMSKAHVAMVIFNRLDDPNHIWGNTLTEIITRPNQFAYNKVLITEQTKQACAFAFEMKDMTQGATSFHSGAKTKTFNGKSYIFTDAVGHHFY